MDGLVEPLADAARQSEPSVLLFRRYPSLADQLPYTSLGTFPTPVGRLEQLGYENLWIKREDLSSPLCGGNKVRKLEFTLAAAVREGRTKVMTMGGFGTNHGLATAIFGRQLGLGTRLLLYPQPVTRLVKEKLLLFHHYGVELRCYRTLLGAGVALYTTQRVANPRAYVLHSGGSSPLGTIGVVNAMFELRAQVDAGMLPEPDFIFCPLGSSGTMAGLSLGGLLAGLKSTVIGVRVTLDHVGPVPIAGAGTVRGLMQRTLDLLRKHSPDVPSVNIPEQQVVGSYFGDGYGYATAAGREAMVRAREREGLDLDPTYTAKTFAAMSDFMARPGNEHKAGLYWHTYHPVDRSGRAASTDYRALPPALHRYFERPDVES